MDFAYVPPFSLDVSASASCYVYMFIRTRYTNRMTKELHEFTLTLMTSTETYRADIGSIIRRGILRETTECSIHGLPDPSFACDVRRLAISIQNLLQLIGRRRDRCCQEDQTMKQFEILSPRINRSTHRNLIPPPLIPATTISRYSERKGEERRRLTFLYSASSC